MLFLAVTLGFFVENQREHFVENKRGKQYIQSFYEDLTADEHDLQINIDFLRDQMQQADTLEKLLLNVNIKQPANRIYMYLREITRVLTDVYIQTTGLLCSLKMPEACV